jgi:tetratricopeptide (TPR) repeat protein
LEGIGLFNKTIELKCPRAKEASMSQIEPTARTTANSCPYSASADFERAVKKAQDLLESSDFDAALELLSVLEDRYMRCARLFDLLGEVFLKKGDLEEGIRYKTVHEVLRGTFRIAAEHAARRRRGGRLGPGAGLSEGPVSTGEQSEDQLAEYPTTVAMAQLLMKQGHFDRAAKIFAKLANMHPDDRELQEAKERARKKRSEKELVGILRSWLGAIDRMKLNRSGGT